MWRRGEGEGGRREEEEGREEEGGREEGKLKLISSLLLSRSI